MFLAAFSSGIVLSKRIKRYMKVKVTFRSTNQAGGVVRHSHRFHQNQIKIYAYTCCRTML